MHLAYISLISPLYLPYLSRIYPATPLRLGSPEERQPTDANPEHCPNPSPSPSHDHNPNSNPNPSPNPSPN